MGTRGLIATALLSLVFLLGTSSAAESGAESASATRPATFAECSDAAIRELRFPRDVTIDEIRVELRDRLDVSPVLLGPVRVQVSAGRFNRRLWVAPPLGRVLSFSPGLRGDRFEVALDPSFVGQASACVTRVDLVQAGTVVASIQP
jgi:hypothetical protein